MLGILSKVTVQDAMTLIEEGETVLQEMDSRLGILSLLGFDFCVLPVDVFSPLFLLSSKESPKVFTVLDSGVAMDSSVTLVFAPSAASMNKTGLVS